jgi:predicted DNA-binding protein (UPF0278 family)
MSIDNTDYSARMTVNVPPTVDEAFTKYIDKRGLVKKELIGRILTWWMSQPEAVRRVASLDVTEGMERAYAAALREMAKKTKPPTILIQQSEPVSAAVEKPPSKLRTKAKP